MADLFGIQPLSFVTPESLKRALLFYKKVVIPDLDAEHGLADLGPLTMTNIEWLRKKGFVFSFEDAVANLGIKRHSPVLDISSDFFSALAKDTVRLAGDKLRRSDLIYAYSLYIARLFSTHFNHPSVSDFKLVKAYPELSQVDDIESKYESARYLGRQFPKIYPLLGDPQRKEQVIEIVIHNIPVPDENTSFEQIIDFSSDPDSQVSLLGLRHWISDTAHSSLSLYEIDEKLEYELHLFEEQIRIHKMKYKTGVLETFFVMTADMIENILKLKFGDATRAVFSLRKRQLSLMEAEIKSPGRELAYLYKARKAFKF